MTSVNVSKYLTAAMVADSLTRRSGVDGWEVESTAPTIPDDDPSRILYEFKVKPPPGWTIVHGEDGSFMPCRMPKMVSFSFYFGSEPVVK